MFVGAIYSFTIVAPLKTVLPQALQYDRGVLLTPLAQRTVQQAGITSELGDRMFTAFGVVWQILEAVSFESAQSATRYAGASF